MRQVKITVIRKIHHADFSNLYENLKQGYVQMVSQKRGE